MRYAATISGLKSPSFGQMLRAKLADRTESAFGVASAFLTVGGIRDLLATTSNLRKLDCRLVAGISNAVTHPQALTEAMSAGWNVRLGSAPGRRIFHPKMMICGRSFNADGSVDEPSFVYVGSSNLTVGGLHKNVECGIVGDGGLAHESFASCFASLWAHGKDATASAIQLYAEEFAKRNRKRTTEDIEALGVSDTIEDELPQYSDLSQRRASNQNVAMPDNVAAASWAGLESFTGEYRFQVEFPQASGSVLNRLIRGASNQTVSILCTEDNTVRSMSYRFYTDNGMFRLNVPNDTPGVQLARRSHTGIALVEISDRPDADAKLTFLAPGPRLDEVVRRSVLLGTWGSTRTRSYGWY